MALTVRDAARLLATDEERIHRWIEAGEIPFSRAHDQLRLNRAELLEWATARGIPLSVEAFRDEGGPSISLARALRIGGVHHDVPGRDSESVLRAVVEGLPLSDPADRDLVCQVLLAAERMGSSAIGEGIAIPHVRRPLVFHRDDPVVALSFLVTPLDFHAPDARPVFAMFTMISPTIGTHLHLLARLAAALHDERFKAAIVAKASAETILREAERLEAPIAAGTTGGTGTAR